MLNLQHCQRGLQHRLSVIGIPAYLIKPFVGEMNKWVTHSGLEWTINRLKSLKIDLIRRQSGLKPLTWIRKNQSDDIGGIFGSLFRWADKSDRNFFRSIQALQAYTYFTFEKITNSQSEKFLNSIQASPVIITQEFLDSFRNTIKKCNELDKLTVTHRGEVNLVTYRGSPNKRSPIPYFGGSTPQDSSLNRELEWFYTPEGEEFYLRYKNLYDPVFLGLKEFRTNVLGSFESFDSFIDMDLEGIPFNPKSIRGGEIHFLQEPGGKLRSVASPYRVHQCALYPLGKTLFQRLKDLPWDCTHNQQQAHPFIQKHLKEQKVVHSVDLSSATDLFPLEIQSYALRCILGNIEDISLFEEISRSSWYSPLGDIQWSKGQPLGLFPSFAVFTLTHGLLLYHLNGGHHDNEFFVVGDDVVILKDSLYSKYIELLQDFECPWSPDKSISSRFISEFAGKIISSSAVFPQYKWRKMSDDNFLDISRNLGKRSRDLLTSRQKKVFDAVKHLLPPFGLNFSRQNSNYLSMMLETIEYSSGDRIVGSLTSLIEIINRNLFDDSQDLYDLCNYEELQTILSTFDEKVKLAYLPTIFAKLVDYHIGLAQIFDDIPEAVGYPILPPKVIEPSRVTTLRRYERKLKDHINSIGQ